MRQLWLFSIAGAALLGICSEAAATEPHVIPGIGPENAGQYSAPPHASPPARTADYGGGFLEMLITGHDPTPRMTVGGSAPTPPQVMPPKVQPGPAQMQHVSYSAPPPASAGHLDPVFVRQEVDYDGPEQAGTIVVDTQRKFLFLVLGDGRALRYGIGVGREGFAWKGVQNITRKAEWPGWTPPSEMLLRQPYLPRHMDGGPDNPLGARALYLGSSLYRIHGTNQPETIGKNVSSGCIRLTNDDVTDLYDRVKVGTKVVVL